MLKDSTVRGRNGHGAPNHSEGEAEQRFAHRGPLLEP